LDLPSIGVPIDNVTVHIVDEHLHALARGDTGELVIGGAGVGRGYRNLPEGTEEKFVPDPFSADPEARLYRTGDLARLRPDGQIAFLGRLDEQVKISGFRIEPQEIGAVLDRHPHVRASFVLAHREHANAEPYLIAYVAAADQNLRVSELRDFLSKHVPVYMIPCIFVRVAELPLTAHGKVDRAALPAPTPENILQDENFEPLESPVEEKVSEIVAALLGIARLGRHDNFFNLGGHSLMGAQIIAKLRDAFGVELSLRDLFDQPTVAGISNEIEQLIHAKLAAMSEEEVERLLASSGM
jgi:acyl carrier protein